MNLYIYISNKTKELTGKSGVGRAVQHHLKAAEVSNIKCVNSLEEADVVHINTVFPSSYFMARKARKKGVPLVYHAHSTEEDFRNSFIGSNAFSWLFKRWIIHCYNQGDVIVTPTEYSKSLMLKYGIKKEMFIVSIGIDLEEYQKNEELGRKFREAYGIRDDEKVIMSTGLLLRRKGVPDFVELARRMPEYRFFWFGTADMRLVGHKIRKAVKTQLPNLTFAGYVSDEMLHGALSGSDLFLFPSYEENEGAVILEALSTKLPLLIRDIPVYADWMEDKKEVYKAHNLDEFEELARGILEKKLPDLRENGYEVAKRKNIAKTGSDLEKVYKRAIELKKMRDKR